MFLLSPLLLSGAEKVTWGQLQRHLPAYLDHHQVTVVTRDGKTIRGRRLALQADQAVIESRLVPQADIARIEIRDRGLYRHHITAPASAGAAFIAFGCSEESGGLVVITCPVGLGLGLPPLAWAAIVAPPVALADGIALLHPPRIYELLPTH